MQFWKGQWKNDAALTLCEPATRGIWIDLLIAMHDHGMTGKLTGSVSQLARFGRCSEQQMEVALLDLRSTGAAEVRYTKRSVTVVNRRMAREEKIREQTRL